MDLHIAARDSVGCIQFSGQFLSPTSKYLLSFLSIFFLFIQLARSSWIVQATCIVSNVTSGLPGEISRSYNISELVKDPLTPNAPVSLRSVQTSGILQIITYT